MSRRARLAVLALAGAAIAAVMVTAALAAPGSSTKKAANRFAGVNFVSNCQFVHFLPDDPIVYPGQPGAAHHHTFFGNTAIDAFTTPANIRSKGNASCRGGTINLSGYWVPSVINTATHKPVAPGQLIVYYKTGAWPYMGDGSVIQPIPAGLRKMLRSQVASASKQRERNAQPSNSGAMVGTTPGIEPSGLSRRTLPGTGTQERSPRV